VGLGFYDSVLGVDVFVIANLPPAIMYASNDHLFTVCVDLK
jgi:hypothetical protein